MPVIAVINKSKLDDADVDAFSTAVDAQLRDDFIPKWEGLDYTPVTFFSNESNLPVASGIARLMIIADTLDVEGASGYHDFQGVPRSIILADGEKTSVTMSHEALEMTADPNADKWVPMVAASTMVIGGKNVALEVADPVEGDTYRKKVSVLGVPRQVNVSNFVLPSWFQPISPGPWDFLGTTLNSQQCSPGGYLIIEDSTGKVTDVFAFAGKRNLKMVNSTSRLYRRINRRR